MRLPDGRSEACHHEQRRQGQREWGCCLPPQRAAVELSPSRRPASSSGDGPATSDAALSRSRTRVARRDLDGQLHDERSRSSRRPVQAPSPAIAQRAPGANLRAEATRSCCFGGSPRSHQRTRADAFHISRSPTACCASRPVKATAPAMRVVSPPIRPWLPWWVALKLDPARHSNHSHH